MSTGAETAIAGIVFEIGIITFVATLLAYIGKALRQPLILAYIVAGILIGPQIWLIAGFPIGLGLVGSIELVTFLSTLGVAFLLFSVGAESTFLQAIKQSKSIILYGIIQVIATALIVFAAMQGFGISFIESVYLGLIIAFSSTTIVVKVLSDKHIVQTLHAKIMLGYLLIQDFLVVLALPLLEDASFQIGPFVEIAAKGIGLIALVFILHKFVLPKIFDYAAQNEELLYLTTLSVSFAFMFLSFILGFSIVIGAFLAGLAISTLQYNLEVSSKIRGLRDFFATIFFVSLGMQLTFSFTGGFPIALFLVLLLLVFILKPIIFFLLVLLQGYGRRIAFTVGLSLAQVSEFSFILAAQGLITGQLNAELFSLVILVTAISMAATPYFMHHSSTLYNFFNKLLKIPRYEFFRKKLEELEKVPEKKELKGHIVVAGAGRVGGNIVELLHQRKHNIVVVDNNPNVVNRMIEKGINAIYASAENEEVWHQINLKEAKLMIVTIPRIEYAIHVIKKARKINPKLKVFARANYFNDILALYKLKVDFVLSPYILASNVFSEKILDFLNTGRVPKIAKIETEFLDMLEK